VAASLTHLQARPYAPTTIPTTIEALKHCCVRVPSPRQPRLSQDLAHTTPDEVDAWLHAAHRQGLAPSTSNHLLTVRHRFFPFLQEPGTIPPSPLSWRRPHVLGPPTLPNPRAEEDVIPFFKVIDVPRDRTMFLLMVRGGLRVGAVRARTWPAIKSHVGSSRIDNRQGQVDRVVSSSPDGAKARRQWRDTQPREATDGFPSPLTHGIPLRVRASQHRMAHSRQVAPITKPYAPHARRHPFATHLLNAGATLEVVKALMGPRSLRMTLRDTQLDEATTRDQDDHARERLEKRHAILDR